VSLLEATLELELRLIEFRKSLLPDHRVPRQDGMQRLTDVPLTFRHANRVGDATDLLWGQRLDAPRPERDGREDRLEGLRRLRDGLPTEAETVLDRLPAVLEQDIDDRVVPV